jgi:hypothetical protein
VRCMQVRLFEFIGKLCESKISNVDGTLRGEREGRKKKESEHGKKVGDKAKGGIKAKTAPGLFVACAARSFRLLAP